MPKLRQRAQNPGLYQVYDAVELRHVVAQRRRRDEKPRRGWRATCSVGAHALVREAMRLVRDEEVEALARVQVLAVPQERVVRRDHDAVRRCPRLHELL